MPPLALLISTLKVHLPRIPQLLLAAGLCAAFAAPATAQSVTRAISQSSDDAEQTISDSSMDLTSTDLELPDEDDNDGPQHVGMRFQNITIPADATIDSAYIQFHVDETRPSTAVTVTFTGEDVDDAVTFSSTSNDIGSRTETTASVDWTIPHWATTHEEDTDQLSPDLATIIQEIVDRSGWASGNDIVILVTSYSGSGTRVVESYDGESANAAELTVTYTPAPVTNDRRLWITSIDDVTSSSVPGLTAWGLDDVLEFADPNFVMEPTDTDGTFSSKMDFDAFFDDGDVNLQAIHYVTRDITVGGGANTFDLERGDLLFGLKDDEDIGADFFGKDGLHVFRPTTAGDYSAGTFDSVLDGIVDQYFGITLVEYDTYVGDQQLYEGEFLYVDKANSKNIYHFAPTGVGIGTTSGTSSLFLDATGPMTIQRDLDGLDLIEFGSVVGDVTLAAGTILSSFASNGSIGDGSLSVADEDIFQLAVSTTYMKVSSSSATATLFFDGDQVSMTDNKEDISGITIWQEDPEPYRSKATGDWSEPTAWERYHDSSWIDASNYPFWAIAEAVSVLSGHTITVDSGVGDDLTTDQTTVDSGGTLVIAQKTIVVDGSGADFTVAGDLTISASKEFNPTSSSSVTVSSGGSVTNTGTLNAEGTSSVTFASGSTYDHSQNGGAFPQAARTTWSSGSTATVTGTTTTLPTELGQSFHHVTWNASGQTAALDLNAGITAIGGNLTMNSTGSGTLSWVQSLNTDLTISGNYVQTGGTFIYTDGTGTGSMYAVDATVSGGTLNLTTSSGTPLLDLDGDLTLSGGGVITETGSGSGQIKFTGPSQQTIAAASGVTNTVGIFVANAAGATLSESLAAPSDLRITPGTLDANSQDITVGGNLSITGDLTNPATITFDGSGAQSVVYGPGTFSLPIFKVDKASGTLTLSTDATVTTTASVLSGTLDVNGQTFTFPTGTTLYNAGTVTGDVVFERNFGLVQDGWRMIASPLDGVAYSTLNTNFHTQGAPWADFTDGVATLQEKDFAAQDWSLIDGADANFAAGEGYIFYMYEELVGTTILPATWSVTGTVRTSATRALSWNSVSTDSYNLVGNRTTSNIDWDAAYAASTNVATTYSTWDPALTSAGGLTGYKYYNQATGAGLAGRYIPPFTAFEVEPSATGGTFVFSTSEAANLASASYFGKRRRVSPHIRLAVEGQGHAELETYLAFDPEALDGEDRFDGNRLRPLSQDYVTMASLQGERSLVFDGRSLESGLQEYTLGLAATQPGLYTLSWPDWHDIPDDWAIVLHDRTDGRRVDLRLASSFVFAVEEEATVSSNESGNAAIDTRPRFTLFIAAGGRAVPGSPSIPGETVLAQNYPNPFNPVTTIRYLVSETAPVRLEVFDTLGRRVSQLVGATQHAGWQEVSWDARNLPSGLYLYRLSVGSAQPLVRTMMLTR